GDNKDQLVEAVRRSLNFFNGQFSWIGNVIGIATSLEEELKHDLDTGEETMLSGEVIENTKVALFGPMAGIGDSITNGTIHYIIIALFLPLVMNGNWIGAVLPLVIFTIWSFIEGIFFTRLG